MSGEHSAGKVGRSRCGGNQCGGRLRHVRLSTRRTLPCNMRDTPLNRQFKKWYFAKGSPEDFGAFERSFIGEAGWPELLKHQRVVVLAEAGGGKSKELEEQAARLNSAGEFAFSATVQNVAKEGLISAVGYSPAKRIDEWRISRKSRGSSSIASTKPSSTISGLLTRCVVSPTALAIASRGPGSSSPAAMLIGSSKLT